MGVRWVSNLTSFTEDIYPPCLKSKGRHRWHACICWMAKRKKHPRSERGHPLISATCTSDGHQFNFSFLFLTMAKNFALPFIHFASFDLVEILVVETSSSISWEQSIIFPYISIWSRRALYRYTNNRKTYKGNLNRMKEHSFASGILFKSNTDGVSSCSFKNIVY